MSSSRRLPRLLLVTCLVSAFINACSCQKQPPTAPTLREETQPCTTDEECVTGLCDAVPGFQPVCVRKCSAGCRADEVCTQLTGGRYACEQDPHGLCRPCSIDSDCPYPADKCIVVDGAGVCGRDCAFDMACPTSYHCVNGIGKDGVAKAQQCSPTSGSCTCTAASAGQTIGCEVKNTIGTCTGVRTCDGVMGYGACNARTPAAETCNGVDDNCNGTTDEDQPAVTCGVGACEVRVPSCGDGGVLSCVPKDAGVETCNGIDDDCNGVIDNGFDLTTDSNNCGVCGHACSLPNAAPRCDARACIVGTCNVGFGNCDGVQSNGCETNTNTDVNNCGGCNNRCSTAGGNATCTNGMCGFTCAAGFIDLDGNPANGCEYACTVTSSTDVPDVDFVDANCDGMDGELGNGIYVATTGDDVNNPGTAAAPKRTIAAGVAAALTQGKRDVYVSAGLYTGPLNLVGTSGINIAGGYAPATPRWTRSSINTTLVSGGNPALNVADAGSTLVQFITFNGAAASGYEANGAGKSAYGARVVNSTAMKLELLNITAGDGVNGVDGVDGTPGFPGSNGGSGSSGVQHDSQTIATIPVCAMATQPSVGTPGTSSCGRTGGTGGAPGLSYVGAGATGGTGTNGVGPTLGGSGGPSYQDQFAPYATPQSSQAGHAGLAGTNGINAAQAPVIGSLSVAGYLPPLAGGGTNGGHGNGGGGGGGGGGGCTDYSIGSFIYFCECYTYGSSGGGGGGGGCAGTAGTAGTSGGASVALMLFNSQVATLRTSLTAGRGGRGGRGGTGGTGGVPGSGASSVHVFSAQGYSGIGGRGGDGGGGGTGGHGAGGTGGASFGLLRGGSSAVNTTGLTFTLGTAGTGGTAPVAPGPNGASTNDQQL